MTPCICGYRYVPTKIANDRLKRETLTLTICGYRYIITLYRGTFLVIIMLKFVYNIRYTVKKSMKQNKSMVIRFVKDFGML